MVFKKADLKDISIATLENLIKLTTNQKQKSLMQKDLQMLKNGYEAEKQNAYYIDFYLEDSEHVIVLHDIRLEYKNKSAQIDHILINRFEITLIESKSFKGKVTINDDNSLFVDYNGKIESFSNPLEQSKRHAELLYKFLNENIDFGKRIKAFGGLEIDNVVLFHPKTVVTNKKLPEGFYRADSYISKRKEQIDKMSTLKLFQTVMKMVTIDTAKELAKTIVDAHKPVNFDYHKKYKISKENISTNNKQNEEVKVNKLTVGSPCPFCSSPLVLRNVNKPTPFLGCSSFPKCKFNRRISKKDASKIASL